MFNLFQIIIQTTTRICNLYHFQVLLFRINLIYLSNKIILIQSNYKI